MWKLIGNLKGKDGATGTAGNDAEIHPDTIALIVIKEVERAISSLSKPKDGAPGRDALQIEILPMIEEGKSYPRGTFALNRGGVVRAVKNGASADIWETVMDGIADCDVTIEENMRTFTVSVERTSGIIKKKSFILPVLIDRGVFRDGTEYEKGDVVTWDSSMWVCIVERTKAKPGTADWRMCVKKGQNGKDGANGKDRIADPGVKL